MRWRHNFGTTSTSTVSWTAFSGSFAVLATLLAAIGLYGMLSYNVAQRTRELGLRPTLGAVPAGLQAMVLKQVGVMALIGSAVGAAAAISLGSVLEALLFGVSGYDRVAYASAVGVLFVVVFAASYLPARRASNIAPMEALRVTHGASCATTSFAARSRYDRREREVRLRAVTH